LEEARSYLEEACRVYERWGGMAKVIRLQEEIHSMFAATKTDMVTMQLGKVA
jgi:hypothetical protein